MQILTWRTFQLLFCGECFTLQSTLVGPGERLGGSFSDKSVEFKSQLLVVDPLYSRQLLHPPSLSLRLPLSPFSSFPSIVFQLSIFPASSEGRAEPII